MHLHALYVVCPVLLAFPSAVCGYIAEGRAFQPVVLLSIIELFPPPLPHEFVHVGVNVLAVCRGIPAPAVR